MSETPNYGLYLEDDASARFQVWREKINGTDNSNMVKIDTALGTMAQKSGKVTGTLLASAWSGIDSPFTQTLAVDGLGADQNGNISVAISGTNDPDGKIAKKNAERKAKKNRETKEKVRMTLRRKIKTSAMTKTA